MNEELMDIIGKLRKELLITRIINSILIVMMAGILIFGGVVVYKVQQFGQEAMKYATLIEQYMAEVEPMIKQLEQVDVAAINKAIEGLDVEAINEAIEALDVETINEAIGTLDVEALNKALDTLETSTEKFQDMMDDISKFFKW